MDAVVVKDLKKAYGSGKKKFEAVRGLSFSIKKGEIFGLLGANGAGKSTTINMLTGLLTPDSGTIHIMGMDPEKETEKVRNMTNVSSAYFSMSDILTVRQNLMVYAGLYNVKNAKKKIVELAKTFQVDHILDKKMTQLSSGQRTRASICKALVNDPKVIFLDECTVGLDPYVAKITRAAFLDYQKRTGASILFTSHNMLEVEEMCDRIAFMKDGKIIRVDQSSKIKNLISQQDVILDFFGNTAGVEDIFAKRRIIFNKKSQNKYVICISTGKGQLFKLMNVLFQKGYKLKDMTIKKATLEDVFIKIIEGEI